MKNESALKEENDRLRGDLLTIAGRVCHDLRTPLGGIMTAAEVLGEILAEEKEAALAQSISSSVDDLTRLIKQISFITRAIASPIPPSPVNMAEPVAYTLQRLENRILEKKAMIVEPPSWPEVLGVSPWLEVIWTNFLTNALQHTTAEQPRIELSWREENGVCRLGISDNGGGVREEIRPYLFQPFHTLHQPNGTRGFGLSIVQRLVELQGGNCGYEPLPGGSFFFFTLPLR